jgi:hypothetical protein
MNRLPLALALLLVSIGLARAQGLGAVGGGGASFAVEQQVDALAYYVMVHHTGFAPLELRIVPMATGLLVTARKAGGGHLSGFEAFSVNQFSQWVVLPPDADLARAERREEPGRILIVVPRRQGGLW